jgi:hypothetical protein
MPVTLLRADSLKGPIPGVTRNAEHDATPRKPRKSRQDGGKVTLRSLDKQLVGQKEAISGPEET